MWNEIADVQYNNHRWNFKKLEKWNFCELDNFFFLVQKAKMRNANRLCVKIRKWVDSNNKENLPEKCFEWIWNLQFVRGNFFSFSFHTFLFMTSITGIALNNNFAQICQIVKNEMSLDCNWLDVLNKLFRVF